MYTVQFIQDYLDRMKKMLQLVRQERDQKEAAIERLGRLEEEIERTIEQLENELKEELEAHD